MTEHTEPHDDGPHPSNRQQGPPDDDRREHRWEAAEYSAEPGGPENPDPGRQLVELLTGTDEPDEPNQPDEPDVDRLGDESGPLASPAPPRSVNWNLLSADEAKAEWLDLNAWVDWLRHTYGLPAAVIPPLWHRHPELVWELSALHTHWLGSYHPDQHASAPVGWHRDLTEACHRLRDRVAQSGTRIDRDRPLRPAPWPGEQTIRSSTETVITDRDEDFARFVTDDVNRRRAAEAWLSPPT